MTLPALRSFFAAPAPERRAAPSRADALLSLTTALVASLECALRPSLPHRAAHLSLALLFSALLSARVARPLWAVSVAFGAACAHTVALREQPSSESLFSAALVLLLPYALARWGSRREIALGSLWIVAAYASDSWVRRPARAADLVGGALALALPLAIGASVRFRDEAARRALQSATERARWREREALARELHDTVAHHVAAVTVQAQAARAVMHKRPELALDALAAIEAESSRALTEMRRVVGSLRDATLEAPARIEDIEDLARAAQGRARVRVSITGTIAPLGAAVHSAVYRIAREAITNALKHGASASAITVSVHGAEREVELHVHNERARATPEAREPSGFGLLGMRERATLLNGSFFAGPTDDGGWTVRAVIPADARDER